MPTAGVKLDVTQYVRVNAGLNPLILQAHRDSVRIAFTDVKPSKSNSSFHLLGGSDLPYPVPMIDTNVWALATSGTSSLVVTEFSGDDEGANPVDTLGEIAVMLIQQLSMITSNQNDIEKQLKLLNIRFEEAFETEFDEDDIQ